jgi:hypothetical protein
LFAPKLNQHHEKPAFPIAAFAFGLWQQPKICSHVGH